LPAGSGGISAGSFSGAVEFCPALEALCPCESGTILPIIVGPNPDNGISTLAIFP
jgi:hypothetical protein